MQKPNILSMSCQKSGRLLDQARLLSSAWMPHAFGCPLSLSAFWHGGLFPSTHPSLSSISLFESWQSSTQIREAEQGAQKGGGSYSRDLNFRFNQHAEEEALARGAVSSTSAKVWTAQPKEAATVLWQFLILSLMRHSGRA